MISAVFMEKLLDMEIRYGEEGSAGNNGEDMDAGMNPDLLKKSRMDLCCVGQTGVGSSAIFFYCGCLYWIHKKRSGIKGPLRTEPNFRCA